MTDREYDALLLDLDGTLLTSEERVHPETAGALDQARAAGVHLMVVTGRSKVATLPVLEELRVDTRTVIFNGAAVYCPAEARLVEERTLSNRAVAACRSRQGAARSSGSRVLQATAKRAC